VDVRNDSVSVATLWENMCVNQINKTLSTNLNEDEKKYLNIGSLLKSLILKKPSTTKRRTS
jgi:hypothetical protein